MGVSLTHINGKILFPVDRTGADIEFPSHQGKEGTCDFMTPICAKECKQLPNPLKSRTLQYFNDHTSKEIYFKILADMQEIKADYLLWFVFSGDCPESMTGKISDVIKNISNDGIYQNGFTRNKEFWNTVKGMNRVRYVLTEEDEDTAHDLAEEGLVAVPDYNTERVKILTDGETFMCGGGYTTCGENRVDSKGYIGEESCEQCRSNKQGCWV